MTTGEAEHEARGVSCDISVMGILVECDGECPPLHAEVQVMMTIEGRTSKFEIGGNAEVTRIQDSARPNIFAADGRFEMITASLRYKAGRA
jgi:hypothetical protein